MSKAAVNCNNFYITKVLPEDLKDICQIENVSFKDPWSLDSFKYELNNSDSIFFKLTKNNGILGYIILRKMLDELHILNIAIKPEYRGQGLSKILLEYVIKEFGKNKLILLEVRTSNIVAQELYKKYGFVTVHTRKSYYPDGEDAIVMIKQNYKGVNNE